MYRDMGLAPAQRRHIYPTVLQRRTRSTLQKVARPEVAVRRRLFYGRAFPKVLAQLLVAPLAVEFFKTARRLIPGLSGLRVAREVRERRVQRQSDPHSPRAQLASVRPLALHFPVVWQQRNQYRHRLMDARQHLVAHQGQVVRRQLG